MRVPVRALPVGLIGLLLVPGTVAADGYVAIGGGPVLGGSTFCMLPPGPSVVHLTMRTTDEGPESWQVLVEAHSLGGCPAPVVTACDGTGTPSAGIDLVGCDVGTGTGRIGPWEFLAPPPQCPTTVCPATMKARFDIRFQLGPVGAAYFGTVVFEATPY